MESLTLFTWGYWGWGTATDQLIKAVDSVETSRGYAPPMFVDIRISRSVRAPGFNGSAFEKAVGTSRYRWLDALGNVAVQDGGLMRIKDPAAANTLLDMAEECGRKNQRILFFCSCEFPGPEGHGCHRVAVAHLVIEAAGVRRLPVQVVEWPGGEPRPKNLEVKLSATAFHKFFAGGASIPLDKPVALAEMAAVPWFSPVAVYENGNREQPAIILLTGPARYKKGEWYLPIYKDIEADMPEEQIHKDVQALRESGRFVSLRTQL